MDHPTTEPDEQYSVAEKGLYQSVLAARNFIDAGQYDAAATIMQASANAYMDLKLASAARGYSEVGDNE